MGIAEIMSMRNSSKEIQNLQEIVSQCSCASFILYRRFFQFFFCSSSFFFFFSKNSLIPSLNFSQGLRFSLLLSWR